jgi:hypothetical protein
MSDKLNINNEMAQLDRKNREFYDSLSDEERKKFSLYLMLRWSSAVQATGAVQAYYLMSCNENLNKNFFDIAKHPKLQWLCATAVSPGIGTFKHSWIPNKKKNSAIENKTVKALSQIFPVLKRQELEMLASINSKDEIKSLLKEHGWDDKRIKAEL